MLAAHSKSSQDISNSQDLWYVLGMHRGSTCQVWGTWKQRQNNFSSVTSRTNGENRMERGRDVIYTKSRSHSVLIFLLYVGFVCKQRRSSRTQPSSTDILLGQFQRGKNKGEYLRKVWICWAWYKRRWTVSLSLVSYLKRNFQPSGKRWEATEASNWTLWFSIAPQLNTD